MRRMYAASVLFLLVAVCASAQSGPVKVLIRSSTQPASAGGTAKTIADWFETQVVKGIREQYPCADVTTMDDIASLLKHDRERQLLGGNDEGAVEAAAKTMDADYLIFLTVTPFGSGQVMLTGSVANASSAQPVARKSSTTAGGDAALDGAEALAKQLVRSLGGIRRFSKAKCEPTNPWVGTVTYHAAEHSEGKEESQAPTGEGTITNTTSTSSTYDATIRIGWTGEPKARITATGTQRFDEVGKIRYNCGRSAGVGGNTANWKSMGYSNLTLAESRADGNATGSVSVTMTGRKVRLQLGVPETEGTTTTTLTKKYDGGCGEPTSDTPLPVESPWDVRAVQLSVESVAGRDPDLLWNTVTTKDGVIVTWKLTRTPMRK